MDRPVKVLQIGMTSNWGGLETYLMQQFDNIDKTKVSYDFVNITNEYDIVFKEKILDNGSNIYGICSRHKNPLKHYFQWISLLCREGYKYKAVVLNSNSLEYVFPMFIGKLFGIHMRIMHSHNAGYEHPIGLLRKCLIAVNRLLMKWSVTDYFACSQDAGEWMFGNNIPFHIIHNAISIERFSYNDIVRKNKRAELGLADQFVVGHVGRFTYQKNHDFLLDIFEEIVKLKPNALLLLAGDYVGDDSFWRKAHEKVMQYGIEDNVRFLGMRNDVPELMQAMDCFVLPSRFEGLGLVGIEAQTAGLPCFFSSTITKELGITHLSNYIDLTSPSKVWAEKIIVGSRIDRCNMDYNVREYGYDIKNEIKKIEEFYMMR